jgi:hypothetical protein
MFITHEKRLLQEEEKLNSRHKDKYFFEDKENLSHLSNKQPTYDKENIPPSKVQKIN